MDKTNISLAVLLPLLSISIALVCAWGVYQSQEKVAQATVETRAENAFNGFRENLLIRVEAVQAMAEIFTVSPATSQLDLDRISKRHIDVFESLQALSLVSAVRQIDREKHELAVRKRGGTDYSLKQWQPDGQWINSKGEWAEKYFPVSYIYPRSGNEAALGIDLASNPTRAIALKKARESGKAVATARIALAQSDSKEAAFLVFVPVYRGYPSTIEERNSSIIGYSSGVFRVQDIVKAVFQTRNVEGLELTISDESATNKDQKQLFSTSDASDSRNVEFAATTHEIGGRVWKFQWSYSAPFLAKQHNWNPLLLILGGCSLSFLLGLVLFSNVKKTQRVEAIVNQRTKVLTETQLELENRTSELESIFQALPLALVYADPSKNITQVNPAFTQVFGFPASEVMGRTSEIVYANPEDTLLGDDRYNVEASSKAVPFNVKYSRKNGSHFFGETVKTVVRNSSETIIGLLTVIKDVTARQAAASDLRINQYAVENSSDAVFWIRKDGSFSNVNKKATEYLGYSKSELCQMRVCDINPAYSIDEWPSHWQETQELGVLKFESMHQRKDGSTYACAIAKHFLSFEDQEIVFATVRDISAQKRADKAIRDAMYLAEESERRFRSLANSASPLFWTTELDSKCSWLNKRWLDYCGDTLENQMGFGWLEVVHPDDRDRVKGVYLKAFEKQVPFDMPYRLRRHDGVYRWHTANATPRINENGEFVGFVGMSFDDQDAKESRQALEESERSLQLAVASLKLSNSDLQQFAYVASHDLQEPLRAISGFTQLLETHYKLHLDERGRGYIEKAISGVERMQQLINDLLHFSQVTRDESDYSQIELNDCIDNAINELQNPIQESKAQIIVGELPPINGVKTQITRLFQNLISNAIKYCRQEAPIVEIFADVQEDHCIIHVKDNGIGIPLEYRDQIFSIFKRLHRREEYPGTGIGLAICNRVVDRHSGSITVESEVGRGSCFKIKFPVLSKIEI